MHKLTRLSQDWFDLSFAYVMHTLKRNFTLRKALRNDKQVVSSLCLLLDLCASVRSALLLVTGRPDTDLWDEPGRELLVGHLGERPLQGKHMLGMCRCVLKWIPRRKESFFLLK